MSTRYTFGPYTMPDSGRVLLRDGKAVPVTPKVLATLLVLVRADGEIVSKEELLQAVWPDSFVEEGNLTQNISVLRKLLAADFPASSPIETVPRLGYRFRGEIRTEEELPDGAAPGTLPSRAIAAQAQDPAVRIDSEPVLASPLQSGAVVTAVALQESALPRPVATRLVHWQNLQPHWKRLLLAMAAVLVMSGVAVFSAVLHKRRVSAASSRPVHPRIAVLTFRNLSHSAEAAWISDALRETLATDLTADNDFRVLPNESVARAERELELGDTGDLGPAALKRVCDNLDCDEVVSGSYVVSGGKVRLDTHLLDASSGAVLSNYSTTHSIEDLLPLINEMGTSVRTALAARPSSSEARDAVRASVSKDAEAFRLYIEGTERLRVFDGRAAVGLLERSVAIDPQFPLSHHELSNAYVILGQEARAVSEGHKAEALAGALTREDQLKIKAGARNAERHFDEAAEIYRMLFAIAPEELDYARMTAAEISYAGRPQQALDFLRPVMAQGTHTAHDPRLYSVVADCYSMMGDWNSSLTWAREGADEAQRRGSKVMYGRLLTTETQALFHLQQVPAALAGTQEALGIAKQFQDYSGQLRALNRLGQIQTAMGQWPQAQSVLEQALALEEQLGESERQIHTLSALGLGLQKHGEPAQASLMFQRQITVARDYGQPVFIAEAELNLARLEMQQGKTRNATEKLRALVQQGAQLNDRQLVDEALEAMNTRPPL